MSAHIAHATATFAELSLAMSIAMLTKIITPPLIVDSLSRETTVKRLETSETRFVRSMFKVSCAISDVGMGIFSYFAVFSFVLAIVSLLGLALCPNSGDIAAYFIFAAAFVAFALISIYVYSSREMLIKTREEPIVEPVK